MIKIIMGSKSDLEVMAQAKEILDEFGVKSTIEIVSAHRTPDKMYDFAKSLNENTKLVIAGAGGAAHLPGMVASLTSVPVIGVPIKSRTLNGVDSLLSIVQMPAGIGVLTVSINGAKNAGLLAIQILARYDKELLAKFEKYRNNMKNTVLEEKI